MPPPPPSVGRQVEEIVAERDRAAAYARLLHLQRACADDPSSAADLAAASPSALLPLLLRDAADHEEAVAASALKCLGFALYHPVLVSTISGQMAQLVLDTLVQLITTTKMKAICNLGVWCISTQQMEALTIEDRVTPLLTAIVYALDNPFGSLSTTFEAAQATMKLATQNPKRMRDLSSIWVPSIYRRLLSADKPEMDMAERCLFKVSPVILPPHSLLSKAVASDLEQKLLPRMINMLDDPLKKVQAVKSWGWFISLLGSSAVSTRPLLNKILKIPEKLFIDPDSQVQIATMVSWRNLVDALFVPHISETMDQETMIPTVESKAHVSTQLKKIRLIMMPLCRVLPRSHNIALSSTSLSTWHYLLCKLGDLVNHLSILEAAFGPVLKLIFSTELDNENTPLWSFCINLFHEFISVRIRHMASPGEYLRILPNQNLLAQSCMHLKALLDVQHIKWLPWDRTCIDFQLEILGSIVNRGLLQNRTETVMASATQIFRLLLQGVRVDCKGKFAYESVQICITKLCTFIKKVFLDLVGKEKSNSCAVSVQFGLQFVKCMMEELDHSVLASGTYELSLGIEHIKEMQYEECSPKVSYPGIRPLPYMEMVSPAVYLTALSLSIVAQFTEELSHGDTEQLALIFCSPDFPENLHAAVAFLHMQIMRPVDSTSRLRMKWLMVWNKVAKHLNEQIISCFKPSCCASGHDALCQFFCYPFLAFLSSERTCPEGYLDVTQDLEVELATEVYTSLCTNLNYGSEVAYRIFLEQFFEYLVSIIDDNMSLFQANLEYSSEKKFRNIATLPVLAEVVIRLLEYAPVLNYADQELKETSPESAGCTQPNIFVSSLKLANRFMRLSSFALKASPAAQYQFINRFFSSLSTFVGHLTLKKGIPVLFEIIGDQLTEWLSLSGTFYCEMQQGEAIDQLEKLWLNAVRCLMMSQLNSDHSFLRKHHLLLRAAATHPHNPISAATTAMQRASGSSSTSRWHSEHRPASKLDGSSVDRSRKGPTAASYAADRAITAVEELDISRMFGPAMAERRIVTANSTERIKTNGESLRISAGVGRKRLKVTKYSSKAKEPDRNSEGVSSPHFVEGKVCRKPELILELLKRKR